MAPVVGYWGIRGLVNPIRLLLEHVGEKYEFESYGPNQDWFAKKHNLGLPFPNLPYLIDGNTKLTQSDAIMLHFARKHGLVGTTEEELQQQDMIHGVLQDLRVQWGLLCYWTNDFEADKKTYRQDKLKPTLDQLEQLLSKREYLVGSKLNYVDFILFEVLDVNTKMFPDLLNDYATLKKYHAKIGGLKGVKEYITSDRQPTAINGAIAKWGG